MTPQNLDVDIASLREALDSVDLAPLATPLIESSQSVYRSNPHGLWEKWLNIIAQCNEIVSPSDTTLTHDFAREAVQIAGIQKTKQADHEKQARLKQLLLQLDPWRKGPFDFFGMLIDSEWRSNLKWDRVVEKISPLRGKRILDVGCGNGYYLWRMLGEGASLALGIDPTQLFIAQFDLLKRYCSDSPAFILPLKSEQFPCTADFDTVFSMGVLAHRRDPHAHLQELQNFTQPGGEVVLETLVVDGEQDYVFVPEGRYAKMRNVYCVPSPLTVEKWLKESGAIDIQFINTNKTTSDEQRVTEWMQFESLADFLDPTDENKTIEGHPAPQRAIFVCRKPE